MNGTEVVYSSGEADLTVSLVAIETKMTSGYHTGNATSVVVFQPCVWKLGTYKNDYDSIQDQLVQVGSRLPVCQSDRTRRDRVWKWPDGDCCQRGWRRTGTWSDGNSAPKSLRKTLAPAPLQPYHTLHTFSAGLVSGAPGLHWNAC